MKKHCQVVNDNQVNLKDIKLPTRALVEILLHQRDIKVSHISHDMNRPWGWVQCNGLYFESGYSALTAEFCIPESKSELDELMRDSVEFNNKQFFEIDESDRKKVTEEVGIELTPEAKFIGGAAGFLGVIDKGIVLRKFPFIRAVVEKDKHQLYPLSELTPIDHGVYRLDGLIIFANAHFRRSNSYVNTLNADFLCELEMCSKTHNPSISLDFDLLGLLDTYKMSLEFEYWWGPKFDASLDGIDYGVTRHGAKNQHAPFNNLKYTDFYWHEQDGKHCFECEEILDEDLTDVADTYNMRYVHSLIDKVSKLPVHLDGAIRSYYFDEYLDRAQHESNIKNSVKADNYKKLWRIDGKIEVELWKRLICHYYRDNKLPGEYFNGEDETITETEESLYSAPESSLTSDEFIRFMISYSNCNQEYASDLIIVDPDKGLKNNSSTINYLEYESLPILKHLKTLGYEVEIGSSPYEYIYFNDKIINLPSFRIVGPKSVDMAGNVLESIRIMLLKLADRVQFASFSLSVLINNEFQTCRCVGATNLIIDLLTIAPKWHTGNKIELENRLMLIHSWTKDKGRNSLFGLGPFKIERKMILPLVVLEGKASEVEIDCSIATKINEDVCPSCRHDYLHCNCSCNEIQLQDLNDAIDNSGEIMLITTLH